ncbi:DEAD/DEAH box helicase [Leeia sp. TBRC 13508]|uniref:DEAD/DEAH box helicase n=1 Tax=Leeia speluncae TaxID=2884804 RepID=A0ABS8D9F6_9NEIS|nr:DEAD/DEAH box helicase [Leeia speluncae]MCB6184835.1 DEAD/DEAH box helicase [Leeia speluncae]
MTDQLDTAGSTVLFSDFNLHARLLRALSEAGYEEPTPIQAAALPVLINGADVMASASTGTGKTAAFLLPILQKINEEPRKQGYFGPRALVLVPTRELAAQVADAATQYGKFIPRFNVVTIVGGMPYPVQNRLLSRPVEVLIATPGRLLDHLSRGRLDLSGMEFFVLDEADRMLDMGFIDDVEAIAAATPADRQTALFSATLDGAVGTLAGKLLNKPERIQIAPAQAKQGKIDQRLHYADDLSHKGKLLAHLLDDASMQQAIIFTATKLDADDLADHLIEQGMSAAALHGDMPQRERNRTLARLKNGHVRVLVATDVAARGIDVDGITHVINYDLPKNAEDYVHRIGRTGRAGRSGTAVSLVSPRERGLLSRIERFIGNRIAAAIVPGLEPTVKPQRSAGPRGNGSRGNGPRGNGPRGGNGGRHAGGQGQGDRRQGGWSRDRSTGQVQQPALFSHTQRQQQDGFGGGRPSGDRPHRGDREQRQFDREPRQFDGAAPRRFNEGGGFDRERGQSNGNGGDFNRPARKPRQAGERNFREDGGNRRREGGFNQAAAGGRRRFED